MPDVKTPIDGTYYYKLVDCCSGETYVYPEGHYLAGYPIYIIYDGNVTGYSPAQVIATLQIITSVTDSLGFEIKGCLLLKPADPPVNDPPVNLQNWADVFFENLIYTPLCCDCNSACGALFFQFPLAMLDYGQWIFSFVGPTGNYNGRNYYQIVNGSYTYYIWYSSQNQAWYCTTTLGDVSLGIFAIFNSSSTIPAEYGTLTTWLTESGDPSRFQSYICKAEEPVVVPVEYKYPEERYQLTCCSTGEALIINGLPAVFVFQGLTSNDNHPDNFLEVVLTTIKDVNANVITGCYRVTEADCFDEWEEILWHDFFVNTECVDTCQECLPKPEVIPPITDHKIIYPDFKVNNVDPYDAEKIFCAFGDANYEKVLGLRFGVEFCCPTDLMQSTIEHEILKMEIAEDKDACCPTEPVPGTCKKYTITIPNNYEGYVYFKDCLGKVAMFQFYDYGNDYEASICGITGQTTQNIYALVNNNAILPLVFVEGPDCN
jgi:hypothetical protein